MTSPQLPEELIHQLPPTLCIQSHAPATGCSKAPRGLLSPLGVPGLFVQVMWVHRVPGGDSGALVDPFMHVGTYPTRHLATLSNPFFFRVGPYLRPQVHVQGPSTAPSVWPLRRPTRLSTSEIISLSLYFLLADISYAFSKSFLKPSRFL